MFDKYCDYFSSPIGIIGIRASEKALMRVFYLWEDYEADPPNPNKITKQAKEELELYFNGYLGSKFETPLEMPTYFKFQNSVLEIMRKHKRGQTLTYKEVGQQLPSKRHSGVSTALEQNEFVIFIPCHLVIRSNGELGFYNHFSLRLSKKIKTSLINYDLLNCHNEKIRQKTCFSVNEVVAYQQIQAFRYIYDKRPMQTNYWAYKDPFSCLISQVLYQQASLKTATKLEMAFYQTFDYDITPMKIIMKQAKYEKLGLSKKKQQTLLNIAKFCCQYPQKWSHIIHKKDKAFITDNLLAIKGVGSWTVWNFMLFGLKLNPVLDLKDLRIKEALNIIFEDDQAEIKEFLAKHQHLGGIIAINLWYLNKTYIF